MSLLPSESAGLGPRPGYAKYEWLSLGLVPARHCQPGSQPESRVPKGATVRPAARYLATMARSTKVPATTGSKLWFTVCIWCCELAAGADSWDSKVTGAYFKVFCMHVNKSMPKCLCLIQCHIASKLPAGPSRHWNLERRLKQIPPKSPSNS